VHKLVYTLFATQEYMGPKNMVPVRFAYQVAMKMMQTKGTFCMSPFHWVSVTKTLFPASTQVRAVRRTLSP